MQAGNDRPASFLKEKTALPIGNAVIYKQGLDSAFNLVGTETSGTSVHMARSPVDNGLDTLNIGLPSTIGTSVGVGHLHTEGHALATIITLRHFSHLLSAYDGLLNAHYKR